MAIVPIRQTTFIPTAFSDSKAGGYVSIFTAQGWDQWRQAVESLGQVAADNQFAYEKKMKAYEAVTQAIATKRGDIVTKIADIQAKKADLIGKYQLKNADLAQKAARDAAQVPSTRTSFSGRFSSSEGRTLWNPKYKAEDGSAVPAGAPSTAVDPKLLEETKSILLAADMTSEDKNAEIAAAAKRSGMVDIAASDWAKTALQDATFVSGMGVAPSQAEAGRRASRSAGLSTSTATGQTWKDYNAAQISELDDPALKEYDTAIKELQGKLGEKGLDVSAIGVPVLEPIDLITTARQIYKEKFGDVPVPTTLKVDGKVVSVLKNLMPFEVTNGMKRSVDFFQRYIDDAIVQARKDPNRDYPDGDLSVDELNRAVEYGKRRAREVLFGVAAPGGDVSGELSGKTSTSQGDPTLPKDDSKAPLSPPPIWPPVDPATFNNEPTGDQPKTSGDQPKTSGDQTSEQKSRGFQPPDTSGMKGRPPSPAKEFLMQYYGSTADAVPSLPPHTYFPTSATYIGQKTEGEIPSYGAPNPIPVGRQGPALIPYSLPPAGELSEPPGRGLEFVPPKPQWMPTRQPGLMPGKSPGMEPIHKPKVLDLDAVSRQHKVDAFVAGTKAATENPKGTAKGLVKDSIGQFVSTLFDENKSKGPNAKPVSTITEQLIKEYSGQPEKQKKAIQRYVELSTLDANSKRIG